jgi:hypothetical protein
MLFMKIAFDFPTNPTYNNIEYFSVKYRSLFISPQIFCFYKPEEIFYLLKRYF